MPGSVSTADGSALVRMGDTTMVCGIKAEIAEPDSARPCEGIISRSPTDISACDSRSAG